MGAVDIHEKLVTIYVRIFLFLTSVSKHKVENIGHYTVILPLFCKDIKSSASSCGKFEVSGK